MKRSAKFTAAFVVLAASTVFAQAPVTVQQPSFSSFSVGTTVSVPDRGTASLGAVRSYSSGSTAYGPSSRGGNRASSEAGGARGSSITATIHDFEAMDKAILGEAQKPSSGLRPPSPRGRRDFANRAALQANELNDNHPLGVNAAARMRERDLAKIAAEAERSFAIGQEKERAGKLGVAKTYYESALKNADEELKPRVTKALSEVIVKLRVAKRSGTAR